MRALLFREPARITALAAAVLAALVAFGIDISQSQQVTLVEVIGQTVGILSIVLGANEITRNNVTPVQDPVLPVGTSVNGGTAEVVTTGTLPPGPDDYRGEGA